MGIEKRGICCLIIYRCKGLEFSGLPLCVFSVSILSVVLSSLHFWSAASRFPLRISNGHIVVNKVLVCCSVGDAPSRGRVRSGAVTERTF